MVISIFILFYFSFKIILTDNLNETNIFYQLKNKEDGEKLYQCLVNLTSPGNKTKEEKTKYIVCIFEEIRDNSKIVRTVVKNILSLKDWFLKPLLIDSDMEFMYDLLNETLDKNNPFIDDLFDVIGNHKELMDYLIFLVKANAEGKNITNYEFSEIIKNITNIDGMDKVFNHIINSTHNGAILKLIETKFLNGTIYAKLYDYFKNDVIYPYKDQIIQLMYKILKAGLYASKNKLNRKIIVYFLELIREYPKIARKIFNSLKLCINDNKEAFVEFLYQNNASDLYNLTEDIFSINSTFLSNLSDVIENHTEIVTNIINLVNGTIHNSIVKRDFLMNLKFILSDDKMRNITTDLLGRHFFEIIQLIPKQINNKTTVVVLLVELKDFIKRHQKILANFICEISSHYLDYPGIVKDMEAFIDACNGTSLIDDVREIINNKTFVEKLAPLINFDSIISNTIVRRAVLEQKLMNLVLDFFKNKTLVGKIVNIILNSANTTYINIHVAPLVKEVIGRNFTARKIVLNSFQNIVRHVLTEGRLKETLSNLLSFILTKLVEESETELDLSYGCFTLFNYTYLNSSTRSSKFKFYYTKKLLIDTTKSKNDFLTYENCLNGYDMSNDSKLYQIKPIYIVGKIIDRNNQNRLKNSSYYEKNNYMVSFCFPQGKNISTNENLCSNDDYIEIIRLFTALFNNVNNATITVFNITEEDIKRRSNPFTYFSLIVIISALPLFISIFLVIYKNIKLSNLHKTEINNKLKSNNKNNKNKKRNEIQKYEFSYGKSAPKWFRYLNEYFNLVKNGTELFNFTLNQTKFNDFNGITYIKGILGISMILNILGLTFLIVVNLLIKVFGSYQFYRSIYNPLFFIAFIGLRYSPRIIFSCSGYTLIYKFLNFIEHEPNFCFFKFLFLQSYKFILLILAAIYLRFCIYYIDTIFLKIKNPTSAAFNEELIQNNGGYFFNLVSFLFYNIKDENEIFAMESAFIPYLYLPINEIFLFFIGITLISLGYKFKLRFDLIIIIFFILIYLFKFIIFIVHFYQKQIYSTLYFFLHGYGILMLNPIFNLPSFLVGMYFGLANFTIQRGINNLNKDIIYNDEYELVEKESISPIKKNKDDDINKIDFQINTLPTNDKIYRALTFTRPNESSFRKDKIIANEQKKKSFDIDYERRKKSLDINMPMETNVVSIDLSFSKSSASFTNFHQKNQDTKKVKIILVIFIILTLFFIFVRYIFIYTNIEKKIKNSNEKVKGKRISDILSLEDLIPNLFLNILYVIDIELVVIMINWIFFYLNYKGGQINDFLSHIYWNFFIKSYFSYTLVSSLVILYILYQSETIIKVNIYTIFFYSFISSFFIFIASIIFYSCYEFPLKKIFKTLKFRNTYINLDEDESYEDAKENINLK